MRCPQCLGRVETRPAVAPDFLEVTCKDPKCGYTGYASIKKFIKKGNWIGAFSRR